MTVIVCISSGELISECLVQLRMKSCDDTRDHQLEDAAKQYGANEWLQSNVVVMIFKRVDFNKSSSSGIVMTYDVSYLRSFPLDHLDDLHMMLH